MIKSWQMFWNEETSAHCRSFKSSTGKSTPRTHSWQGTWPRRAATAARPPETPTSLWPRRCSGAGRTIPWGASAAAPMAPSVHRHREATARWTAARAATGSRLMPTVSSTAHLGVSIHLQWIYLCNHAFSLDSYIFPYYFWGIFQELSITSFWVTVCWCTHCIHCAFSLKPCLSDLMQTWCWNYNGGKEEELFVSLRIKAWIVSISYIWICACCYNIIPICLV